MAVSKRESVLWSVYDPILDRTNYLMGTMHLKDLNAYTYAFLAEKYVPLVDSYSGEMHLEHASEADLHQYFQLPSDQSLSDYYTPRQFKRMSSIFYKITGVHMAEVIHLTPMAITNIIAEAFSYEDYGLALDHHLWSYATKLDKALYGLESVQDQIDILQSIPMQHQVTGLKQVLRNVNKFGKSIITLGDLYAQGKLHKLYSKSKKSLGPLKLLMLYRRNENMVNRFISLSKNQSLFAAVGAAHLSGKHGMLHLLRYQGYEIKPIFE